MSQNEYTIITMTTVVELCPALTWFPLLALHHQILVELS